jgi:hypothetical protein
MSSAAAGLGAAILSNSLANRQCRRNSRLTFLHKRNGSIPVSHGNGHRELVAKILYPSKVFRL